MGGRVTHTTTSRRARRRPERKERTMRRILPATTGVLLTISAMAAPALAEQPVHERVIVKDVEATIPPPPECTGPAATLDLTFHLQSQLVFTSTTFHATETNNGTWTARDASGAMTASGHFAGHTSVQAPGEPTLVFTDVVNATGTTVDGEKTNFHLIEHLTITPDGDVQIDFERASCAP
jgi:hypothetical protein